MTPSDAEPQMIGWAILDAAGCVIRAGLGRDLPPGAVPLPEGLAPCDAARLLLAGGAWVARPPLPPPLVAPGEAGTLVSWSGLPEGTALRVADAETGCLLAEAAAEEGRIAALLEDPGTYLLDLAPPAPWLPASLEVTR